MMVDLSPDSGNQNSLTKFPTKEHCYARLQRLGYPSFVEANTNLLKFVSEDGIIEGRYQFGPLRGLRRWDHPGKRPKMVEILAALAWLEASPLTSVKAGTVSSYRLKHIARNYGCPYVSPGAMIIAADRAGFPQHGSTTSLSGSLNTMVGVSKRSVKNLHKVFASMEARA
ncbi:hypothetical protein [Rhodopirellula bahusiensis]|nr:hypothetical protein [Rhodopirellula bahusiensis]